MMQKDLDEFREGQKSENYLNGVFASKMMQKDLDEFREGLKGQGSRVKGSF